MSYLIDHKLDFILLTLCLSVMLFFNICNRDTKEARGFQIVTSTTPAMIEEMDYAIKNGKLIAVTAWRPHWMNAKLKMRYLEDPENIFGGDEDICTIVRRGFAEDHPQIARFLRQFQWNPSDLETLTWKSTIRKGEYEANAREWINENPELVAKFLDGVLPEPGAEIKVVNNGYLNELATGNMIKILLEERLQCRVTLTATTLPIAFEALANGTQDVSLSVWLPSYHAKEYAAIADRVVKLNVNLHGTRLGIAVPEYAPVYSISDLIRYREDFDGKIIGVEPGQGINRLAEEAILRYGLQGK